MKKTFKKITVFFIVLLAVCSAVFANGTEEQREFLEKLPLVVKSPSTETATETETSTVKTGKARINQDLAELQRLYYYLDENFLWDIDYDAVYDAMATAMFDALGDKYTYYVTAEESSDYEESTLGQYGGLGFYLSKTNLDYQDPEDLSTIYCNIQQVFPNSPAAYGGLKAGDMITHIDGESVDEMEATDCSNAIKGEVGTEVTLTILRGGASFQQTFKRAKVDVPTIISTMIEGTDIGYLQILQFYEKTSADTQTALKKLLDQGMKSLIIDLRNCPGGVVDSSLAIADMFISSSKLLTVNYKNSAYNETMWASENLLIDPSLPVVILVNENSASSSEILSATMKDNGRAVLIGTTTFGKGIMQSVSMYNGADTSVTVASFIPPSGNEIHQVGVTPDIEVPSLSVGDEYADKYVEVHNSGKASDFVDAHPEYTQENVKLFAQENSDTGLPAELLYSIVQTEYYSRMTYDEQPVCDVWFDAQLKAAIDYLSGNYQEEK